MTPETYQSIKAQLIELGYGEEINCAENVKPPKSTIVFVQEYIWVVINSGMKNQIAQKIYDLVKRALNHGDCLSLYFGHEGKRKAIEYVYDNGIELFKKFKAAENVLDFCLSLPWIGPVTKYHLAKNYGHDCCKPDRHLVRIAEKHKTTPEALCEFLSKATGDRIATVDLVIWRAANLGLKEVA
jgi:hypothetical protein